MDENTPVLSYAELTDRADNYLDRLLNCAAKETEADQIQERFTQCTVVLSMWELLVLPYSFPSYQNDYDRMVAKILAAAEELHVEQRSDL